MSFKVAFITFAVIIILALIGGGIFIWYQGRQAQGLKIDLEVPPEAEIGSPFTVKVKVSNDSDNILRQAELMLEVPEEVAFISGDPDKTIEFKELGDLGAGSLAEEEFQLLVLGGENSIKEIKASVSYLPSSLGSKFEKSASINFLVQSSKLNLDLSLPERVFSGEQLEASVSYKNSGTTRFEDLKLKIILPPAFTFLSASPKPDFGNNLWEIGDLGSGSEGKIAIKGSLAGPEDAFFELKTVLEMNIFGRNYVIAEKTALVTIEPSPLSLEISLNKDSSFVAHLGDELAYTLSFINNTDVALREVLIKAKLSGVMYDFSTLSSNAFLRPSDNTLIWNTSNTSSLGAIPPAGSGSVDFRIRIKDSYPIRKLSDKNFILKIEAEIESPTVPYGVSASKTIGLTTLETKVGGQINVVVKGFFRDAESGILNRGPWPLKVGQPTNFTVHWLISNYATDVKNVTVKAFLGGNVKMTDKIKSNTLTKPVYNERTQEVVWNIDSIPAGKGVINPPLEAIFQIEATPSVNQVGSHMVLFQETDIEAGDQFTEEILTGKDAPITSGSLDDPSVSPDEGIVQP